MPSSVFKRVDTRFFAAAFADNTTHDGIGTFELSLGISTEGNKGHRANQVVQHIFGQPNTDAWLLQLLNYLFVENPYANTSETNETYTRLRKQVLDIRGVGLTDNGFVLPDGRSVDDIEKAPLEPTVGETKAPASSGWIGPADSQAPRHTLKSEGTRMTQISRDPSKVFVVHGRDLRPVKVLRQFLSFLGLQMMEWSEAVKLTEKTQPHTYEVVAAGMQGAAAVIIIFSPDDMARIKDEFSDVGDPDRIPSGQPRQNVTLEAGMAYAMDPERTIFVKSALTREISDIAGFNWVKLNGEWDSRADLRNRLVTAKASVHKGEYDLRDPLAGRFKV